MRALTRRDGAVQLDDVMPPVLVNPGDVRVCVEVAGVCRTDLYVAQGRVPVREPLILGHEFCGIVKECGLRSGFTAGDRVTAVPLLSCGECAGCNQDLPCARPSFLGVDLDGAFAEEIVIPGRYLKKVPATLDPRMAAYTEPIAAALAVLNAPLPKNGAGLVLGAGRIAELTDRILKHEGFTDVRRLSVEDAAGVSNDADFVIETEANEATLRVMMQALRPFGLGVLKSRPIHPVPLDVALAVKKDIRLFAVSYGSFDRAIELIESDALALEDFLGSSFALDAFDAAFTASLDEGSVKVFFQIGS